MILEKAWAKFHGSYSKVESGDIPSTLRDLTGAPAYQTEVDSKPDKEIIKMLKSAFE